MLPLSLFCNLNVVDIFLFRFIGTASTRHEPHRTSVHPLDVSDYNRAHFYFFLFYGSPENRVNFFPFFLLFKLKPMADVDAGIPVDSVQKRENRSDKGAVPQ